MQKVLVCELLSILASPLFSISPLVDNMFGVSVIFVHSYHNFQCAEMLEMWLHRYVTYKYNANDCNEAYILSAQNYIQL